MDFLNELNDQQKTAVTAEPGQTLVLAGPGSGKTRVLTYRIAYLISALGVRPYSILAVTFTNKAAREMQARVDHLLGGQTDGLWLGTFHSQCARILRREAEFLPFTASFVIMDADDQEKLVKMAIKDLNLNEKMYRPSSMLSAISRAKNNLELPATMAIGNYRDEVVKRVYERYQVLLQSNNSVDFDDLLLWTVRLLQENPAVGEKYHRRFGHILVDEFQDTNKVQYEMLRLLAGENSSLFVVGDEDQSIYRWRGADYRNVLRFEEDYPNCQKILLEKNYRSTQVVLDAARAVIDHNSNRTPKHLTAQRGVSGNQVTLFEAEDDHAEAEYVVNTIVRTVVSKEAKPGDFAVMYRTNAQSRLLEEAFLRSGMPYRLVGAQRFYGRREVKDVIAYLRLAQNTADEISLTRVINVPPRKIGDKTVEELIQTARQSNISAGAVLLDLAGKGDQSSFWNTFKGRSAILLADFGALLARWGEMAAGPLPALIDKILEDVRYQEYLDDGTDEGKDRWDNVQEVRKLAYEFQGRGLVEFLENMALVSDQDTVPEASSAPTLLTLHAAKGLEFSRVIICGLDEGLLPHSRSLEDPEEMAEERRLFYVGLTRAKNHVDLVRAERRSTYGSFEDAVPSRFLADIPEGLLDQQGIKREDRRQRLTAWDEEDDKPWRKTRTERSSGGRSTGSGFRYTRADNSSTYHVPPPPRQEPPKTEVVQMFKATMRVSHPVWGEGIIMESKIEDGEEVVDVMFKSVGFKRLIASLAKLTAL